MHLCSTGNPTQCSVVTWMVRKSKQEGLCVHLELVHSAVPQKPTQRWKATKKSKCQSFRRVRLCDLKDCSPPGSPAHGILQASILEWVATPSSRGSSRPGIEPASLKSPALVGGFFTTGKPPRKPSLVLHPEPKLIILSSVLPDTWQLYPVHTSSYHIIIMCTRVYAPYKKVSYPGENGTPYSSMFPSTQPRTCNRISINVTWKRLFMIFPLIVLQSYHSKSCTAWRFSYGNLLSFKTPFYILNLLIYSYDSKTFPLAYNLWAYVSPDNYFCHLSLEYRPLPQYNISIADERPAHRANIWGQ